MKDTDWLALDDDALEQLVVERFVFRGVLLVIIMAAAIGMTYLGTQGLSTLIDKLIVGALLVLGLSVGGVAFVMRLRDVRMLRELRERHSRPAQYPSGTGNARESE